MEVLQKAGKNRAPEENARREKIRELLQLTNVSRITDKILPIAKEWQQRTAGALQ